MELPILSADKTEVKIGDATLKVGDSIDYKSATERQVSAGKIESLMYAGYRQTDSTSVWMLVRDIVNSNVTEWISVYVWNEQRQRGFFKNISKPKKQKEDVSEKPTNPKDLPF